jgi:hypothetical protein
MLFLRLENLNLQGEKSEQKKNQVRNLLLQELTWLIFPELYDLDHRNVLTTLIQ